MDWPNFFVGVFYSAVPKQWWGSWRPSSTVDLKRSVLLSGFLEIALCLYLLAKGYFHFLVIRTHQLQAAAGANQSTQLYFVALVSIEYVFRPTSLILLGLSFDGAVRFWAVFFTDEVISSLPLALVSAVGRWRAARRHAKLISSAAPDLIEPAHGTAYNLRISSQYPKDGWRVMVTIAVEDKLYEIAEIKNTSGSHPFVYLLRALPDGAVIRGLQRYDPPQRS